MCAKNFLDPSRSGAADIVFFLCRCLHVKACTAGLNGLNLGLGPGQALEALGKLGAIEEGALSGFNRAKRRAWRRSDVASRVLRCLVQRSVLLSLLAIACEGVGKRVGGRGWVDLRCVVDLCRRMSATQAIEGHAQVDSLLGVVRLPRKRIMGWRPCWRILVAFIVMA